MKLVIIFMNRIEYLDDLLTAFLEIGVKGATVIDSVGMGRIISYDIPIFAGLRDAFPSSSPGNKTIFTVVKDEMLPEIQNVIQEVCNGFDSPGSGLLLSLPIDFTYGFGKS